MIAFVRRVWFVSALTLSGLSAAFDSNEMRVYQALLDLYKQRVVVSVDLGPVDALRRQLVPAALQKAALPLSDFLDAEGRPYPGLRFGEDWRLDWRQRVVRGFWRTGVENTPLVSADQPFDPDLLALAVSRRVAEQLDQAGARDLDLTGDLHSLRPLVPWVQTGRLAVRGERFMYLVEVGSNQMQSIRATGFPLLDRPWYP